MIPLDLETASLPIVGDFIEVRGEEFLVVKRLWTPDVESSEKDVFGVKIILRPQ